MALGGIGGIDIPDSRGRRKHGNRTRQHAAAIAETPVGISRPLDSAETAEGASGSHNPTPPGETEVKDAGAIEKYRDPGKEDFKHLGDLLVYLRQTYVDRISGGDPDRPHSELKAAAVVEYLRKHDYSMTSGSYSMLERGKTLPRNPEQFLDIISKCFRIDRSSKYWVLLRRQYVYDHTLRFVGKEFAVQVAHGSAFLRSLRGEPPRTDTSLP